MARQKKKKTTKKATVKKTRRNSAKNSALDPKYSLKSRVELVDFDYLHKLNAKELEWLNKFAEEEIHASFSENNKENFNKTDAEKQAIYRRNNTRNHDILTRKKTRKQLDYFGDKELERKEINLEDFLIEKIDGKKR